MIHAVGKVTNFSAEFKGSNGFKVAKLEIDVAGKPLEFTATSDNASRIEAYISELPQNTVVEVVGKMVYRAREGKVYSDLEMTDVLILGSVGQPAAIFKDQGFIKGLRKVPLKNGNVLNVGVLEVIAFGREGHIAGATIEVNLNEDAALSWEASVGQLALVKGKVSGRKNERGRVWVSFNADTFQVSPIPSYMAEYASVTPVYVPQAVSETQSSSPFDF